MRLGRRRTPLGCRETPLPANKIRARFPYQALPGELGRVWGSAHNMWPSAAELDGAQELMEEYDAQHPLPQEHMKSRRDPKHRDEEKTEENLSSSTRLSGATRARFAQTTPNPTERAKKTNSR